MPESVRLVVGRRLERLGDDARKVLAAGAVVGRGFPFDLLEQIVDVESGRLIDIVEAAEDARVIVAEERGGEVHYSFGHELIRQTLLSGLSVLRRQRLHLAVADAIERTDRRARIDRPSEIAHHLLAAGSAADSERTLEFLELTAERALEAAAFEEALRALDDALTVLDSDDPIRWARARRAAWVRRAGTGSLRRVHHHVDTGDRRLCRGAASSRRLPSCASRWATCRSGSTASMTRSPPTPAGWRSSASSQPRPGHCCSASTGRC